MTSRLQRLVFALAIPVALTLAARAEAPRIYAITGARIVTAAGPVIEAGTIVLRGGLIDAVGAGVTAPPDAWVIDGKGLTVYPGLIDMGTTAAVEVPRVTPPQNPATTEELERWKRDVIFRPQFLAADHIKTDSADLGKFASAGITTVLAIPDGTVMPGQSALVNVKPPDDEPQIGSTADLRAGLLVVKTPVALHVEFSERAPGAAYPESLMGAIAFLRQSFLDAQRYRLEQQAYARKAAGAARPVFDPALEALGVVLDAKVPVAFVAGENREIRRVLKMAAEFRLENFIPPDISGMSKEEGELAWIDSVVTSAQQKEAFGFVLRRLRLAKKGYLDRAIAAYCHSIMDLLDEHGMLENPTDEILDNIVATINEQTAYFRDQYFALTVDPVEAESVRQVLADLAQRRQQQEAGAT